MFCALVYESHEGALNRAATSSLFPPLTQDESAVNAPSAVQGCSTSHSSRRCLNISVLVICFPAVSLLCFVSLGVHQNTPKTSPQNMPRYRNVFNDRARRDFCYWLIEEKGSTCKYVKTSPIQ